MKATCPVCGNYGPIESFLAQEDYKKALAVITELPGELPRLTVRYLSLFRKPGSDRALTGSRVLKLVSQLRDLATANEIQWKGGRVHQNRPEYWEQAIQAVLDRADQGKIERPLDGHNYVRAIAYENADRSFEDAHKRKERERSYRPDAGGRSAGQSEPKPVRRPDGDNDNQAPGPQDAREIAKRWLNKRRGDDES